MKIPTLNLPEDSLHIQGFFQVPFECVHITIHRPQDVFQQLSNGVFASNSVFQVTLECKRCYSPLATC